jgi:excisionase family DNA binding protein
MSPEKRWLTIAQAADLLSINRKTAYSWAARGILPTVRVGGALRVDKVKLESDFEHQIRQREVRQP